jgi:hypothetical protein
MGPIKEKIKEKMMEKAPEKAMSWEKEKMKC